MGLAVQQATASKPIAQKKKKNRFGCVSIAKTVLFWKSYKAVNGVDFKAAAGH